MKNNKKTAMISTVYPSSGGVATYTKYLFDEAKKMDNEILILADKVNTKTREDKSIIRCWDKNPKYVYQILKEVIKQKIKRVHIQQELNIFGGKFTAVLLPFLILFLRVLRVEVIMTVHGVVPLKEVNKAFMKENGYEGSPKIQKFAIKILYSFICLFVNKIIVHEKKFKEYLEDYYVNTKKVYVIGHGIKELKDLIPENTAKSKLKISNNKYAFIYLGYVTGYKGIDLIIEALKELKDQDFNFIVVGSKHPRRKEEKEYLDYYNQIQSFFKKDKRCIFFDYAPEEEINYFFRAADCAVFPYTVQIASSGPMALAIANERLVIGSSAFEGVLPRTLIFKRDKKSLIHLMKKAKSGKLNNQIKEIKNMKDLLSWENVAKKTIGVWKK